MWRSISGSHINVWLRDDAAIQRKRGKSIFWRVLLNRMTFFFVLHLSMCIGVYFLLGLGSLIYMVLFAFFETTLLESINYIEHYGLERGKDENGIYETISPMHSWNARQSAMAFRIQRHSDHHAYSYRPYQILRRFQDAPTMAFDYPHSMLMSFLPPLWFYCMNPRVLAVRGYKDFRKNYSYNYE
jgi:alkane 1-monooxygenase